MAQQYPSRRESLVPMAKPRTGAEGLSRWVSLSCVCDLAGDFALPVGQVVDVEHGCAGVRMATERRHGYQVAPGSVGCRGDGKVPQTVRPDLADAGPPCIA
jgi:hypothetical protein